MKKFNPKDFTNGAIACHTIEGGYDEIKFEGILCSAIFDSTTGEKSYFTVNKEGKVLDIFDKHTNSNPCFNICMKEDNTSEKLMENGKSRFVEIIRYFRTWDFYNEQISNFGGMTAICVMDYSLRQIRVFPSFCHPEDNFFKEGGLKIARINKEKGKGFVIKLTPELTLRDNIESSFCNNNITWLNEESKHSFISPLTRFIT